MQLQNENIIAHPDGRRRWRELERCRFWICFWSHLGFASSICRPSSVLHQRSSQKPVAINDMKRNEKPVENGKTELGFAAMARHLSRSGNFSMCVFKLDRRPRTMLTPALILLVTAVTMTQADQMSDLLNLPAHKQHIYIFEVISEASVHNLKAALSNFTIHGAYKVVGEKRFFFEIISNDTAKLRALKFPAGSKTTQYPVEHLEEYMEMFGVKNKQPNLTEVSLPNTVLLFADWEIKLPETICSKTFEMEMREYFKIVKSLPGIMTFRAYPILASYPPRILFFNNIEENAIQNYIKNYFPALGGYGQNRLQNARVVKI